MSNDLEFDTRTASTHDTVALYDRPLDWRRSAELRDITRPPVELPKDLTGILETDKEILQGVVPGPIPIRTRTPWWVWVMIPLLAALQPAAHLVARYAPPEGMVPTGLHTPDSAIFIQSMEMFSSGYYSPYATSQSPYGDYSALFFPMPHQWFYGLQGLIADAIGADHFLFYGLCNGLCAAAFLIAIYFFMRTFIPRWSNSAFLLYAAGGGLGGILYLASRATSIASHPSFENYFSRFALYELLEGARFFPATFYGRSYYTVSIALCLVGFALFHRVIKSRSNWPAFLAGLPVLAGTFINLRIGTFTICVFFLYLLTLHGTSVSTRTRKAVAFLVPAAFAWLVAWLFIGSSPTAAQNHFEVGDMNMWLSPFLSCVVLSLLIVPSELWRRANGMPPVARLLAMAAMGYLVAFAGLFIAYQVKWGNVLIARDGAVSVAISDWALLGACVGGLWALKGPKASEARSSHDWIVLWTLGFLVVALSAWGNGWLLRFGPERLILMLYLPWSIVAAAALERLAENRPRRSQVLRASIVACGICSLLVSTFVFQSSVGRLPEKQPFQWTHAEVMSAIDADVIDRFESDKRVLTTLPMADIVANRTKNAVVFGIGTFNMSDVPFTILERGVTRFFSKVADGDAFRMAFVNRWQADYVYCPDTWPIDEEVIQQLRESPWLVEVEVQANAVLFEVIPELTRGYRWTSLRSDKKLSILAKSAGTD